MLTLSTLINRSILPKYHEGSGHLHNVALTDTDADATLRELSKMAKLIVHTAKPLNCVYSTQLVYCVVTTRYH